MGFTLGPGLSFTRIGSHAVFIDTERDRYFTLTPHQQSAFDSITDRRVPGAAEPEEVDVLMRSGIILKTDADVIPQTCVGPRSEGQSGLGGAKPTSVSAVTSALLRLTAVRIELARKPLGRIFDRLRRAKAGISEPRDAGPMSVEIGKAFAAADRIVSPHRRCLRRSLSLATHLTARGIDNELVVGVALHPFRAHCWVQRGSVVLNDDVDRIGNFSPVLVV